MADRISTLFSWAASAFRHFTFQRSCPADFDHGAGDFADGVTEDSEDLALEPFAVAFADLVSGLESRFLPLGENLCEVVTHLQHLVRVAEDGFSSLRITLAGGALGELDGLGLRFIEIVQARLTDVSRHMEPLHQVALDLSRLSALGNELKRVGAFLRACGSNFAVESARREESREAFSSFVCDLRSLAAQIETLAEHMVEASHATVGQIGDARARIDGNVEKVRGLAGLMHGAFSSAAGEICGLLAQTRETVDRIEHHRLAIAEQAASIIYYLQFGDLVRQQCEHVVSAVRDAARAASSDDEAEQLTLPLIVRTAVAQMELIQGEVNEARQRLTDSYGALERELEQLAACGRDLDHGDTGSRSPWTRLRVQLLELDAIQQQEQRLSEDARKTAGEAGAAVTRLHAGLASVREVSGNLHFLALNAIVQTARLSERHRTLEELAKHVNGLHRDCEVVVPRVMQLLDAVGQRVAQLMTGGHDAEQLDLSGLQQMEQAQKSSHEAMREILALGAAGEDKLKRAVTGLDILSSLAAQIAEHRITLEAIRDRLPDPALNGVSADLEARIMERYTMQSERDAHLRALGGTPSPANSTVHGELALAPAGADDLGDNIELF